MQHEAKGSEDFATLLEQYLPPSREAPVFEKVDNYGEAVELKKAGELEKSYRLFEAVLEDHSLNTKSQYHAIGNLVHISLQMANRAPTSQQMISWMNTTYYWFNRFNETEYEVEEMNFTNAIQVGKLKHQHQTLVESVDQKRQLLLEAYTVVNSLEGIVTANRPTWHFPYHSTRHLIARSFCNFTPTESQQREIWLNRWLTEAKIVADIADPSKNLRGFYLASAAFAAEYLAEGAGDSLTRLKYLQEARDLMAESVSTNERLGLLNPPGRLIVTGRTAFNMAKTMSEPQFISQKPESEIPHVRVEQYNLLLESIEIFNQTCSLRNVALALDYTSKICQTIQAPSAHDQYNWLQEAHDTSYKAGLYWQQLGVGRRAENSFRTAKSIAALLY